MASEELAPPPGIIYTPRSSTWGTVGHGEEIPPRPELASASASASTSTPRSSTWGTVGHHGREEEEEEEQPSLPPTPGIVVNGPSYSSSGDGSSSMTSLGEPIERDEGYSVPPSVVESDEASSRRLHGDGGAAQEQDAETDQGPPTPAKDAFYQPTTSNNNMLLPTATTKKDRRASVASVRTTASEMLFPPLKKGVIVPPDVSKIRLLNGAQAAGQGKRPTLAGATTNLPLRSASLSPTGTAPSIIITSGERTRTLSLPTTPAYVSPSLASLSSRHQPTTLSVQQVRMMANWGAGIDGQRAVFSPKKRSLYPQRQSSILEEEEEEILPTSSVVADVDSFGTRTSLGTRAGSVSLDAGSVDEFGMVRNTSRPGSHSGSFGTKRSRADEGSMGSRRTTGSARTGHTFSSSLDAEEAVIQAVVISPIAAVPPPPLLVTRSASLLIPLPPHSRPTTPTTPMPVNITTLSEDEQVRLSVWRKYCPTLERVTFFNGEVWER